MTLLKDPPPWVPAVKSHTTSATSDNAETHLVRAVNTGIIDASSYLVRFPIKPSPFTDRFGCSRVRSEAETVGTGTGSRESEAEGGRKGESTYVISVPRLRFQTHCTWSRDRENRRHWTWPETAMTSENSDSEPDSLHFEFDPEVKWPEINQVNGIRLEDLIQD